MKIREFNIKSGGAGVKNGFLSFSEKNGIIAKIVDTKEVKKRSVHIFVEKRKERKMGKIKVESCEIEGLKVITPTVFGDERGILWRHTIRTIP